MRIDFLDLSGAPGAHRAELAAGERTTVGGVLARVAAASHVPKSLLLMSALVDGQDVFLDPALPLVAGAGGPHPVPALGGVGHAALALLLAGFAARKLRPAETSWRKGGPGTTGAAG